MLVSRPAFWASVPKALAASVGLVMRCAPAKASLSRTAMVAPCRFINCQPPTPASSKAPSVINRAL